MEVEVIGIEWILSLFTTLNGFDYNNQQPKSEIKCIYNGFWVWILHSKR